MNGADMNIDSKPGVLRSTGKNGEKRNVSGPFDVALVLQNTNWSVVPGLYPEGFPVVSFNRFATAEQSPLGASEDMRTNGNSWLLRSTGKDSRGGTAMNDNQWSIVA